VCLISCGQTGSDGASRPRRPGYKAAGDRTGGGGSSQPCCLVSASEPAIHNHESGPQRGFSGLPGAPSHTTLAVGMAGLLHGTAEIATRSSDSGFSWGRCAQLWAVSALTLTEANSRHPPRKSSPPAPRGRSQRLENHPESAWEPFLPHLQR